MAVSGRLLWLKRILSAALLLFLSPSLYAADVNQAYDWLPVTREQFESWVRHETSCAYHSGHEVLIKARREYFFETYEAPGGWLDVTIQQRIYPYQLSGREVRQYFHVESLSSAGVVYVYRRESTYGGQPGTSPTDVRLRSEYWRSSDNQQLFIEAVVFSGGKRLSPWLRCDWPTLTGRPPWALVALEPEQLEWELLGCLP